MSRPMNPPLAPDPAPAPPLPRLPALASSGTVSVCDLNGAERFLAWALRWRTALHDDEEFAADCLEESFRRAGLSAALQAFETYVREVHPVRQPCAAAQRLGCWHLRPQEATVLQAIACLQAGSTSGAARALASVCPPHQAFRAMAALRMLAHSIAAAGGQLRCWDAAPG